MFQRTTAADISDLTSEENQNARTILRERFLKVLTDSRIMKQSCKFHMFDNTQVTAEFCGSDVDIQRIAIRNLKTNLGEIPSAVLRTEDIIRVNFPQIRFPKHWAQHQTLEKLFLPAIPHRDCAKLYLESFCGWYYKHNDLAFDEEQWMVDAVFH